MNINILDKKLIEVENQLSELKEMRKMYLKHFSENGAEITVTTKWVKKARHSNSVHAPTGIYEGLTIKAASLKCLQKARLPLDARDVASVIFDAEQTSSKKFQKMKNSAWSSLYQQPKLVKRNADGLWLTIK